MNGWNLEDPSIVTWHVEARLLLQEVMSEASSLGIDISPLEPRTLIQSLSNSLHILEPNIGEEDSESYSNAAAMVSDANRRIDGIGRHISTYASSSTLYSKFKHIFEERISMALEMHYSSRTHLVLEFMLEHS